MASSDGVICYTRLESAIVYSVRATCSSSIRNGVTDYMTMAVTIPCEVEDLNIVLAGILQFLSATQKIKKRPGLSSSLIRDLKEIQTVGSLGWPKKKIGRAHV